MPLLPVLVRGGGDLASGAAIRLHRAGFSPIITEIESPLAVRRWVSFSEAVYDGSTEVEGVLARRASGRADIEAVLGNGEIPVIVDPDLSVTGAAYDELGILAVVDARLTKRTARPLPFQPVIGLGPGFTPGENCTAVVETRRGHTLGRVYRDRSAEANTGLPEGDPARVLRTPEDGILRSRVEIGERIARGQIAAEVELETGGRIPVKSGISGVVRGMIRDGLRLPAGMKIGDVDARSDPSLCSLVSDKALAVGGGVLEALLACGAVDLVRAPEGG